MAVRLYDTLSREVRELTASDGRALRFYCCGPTVYGPAHIGNFRTFLYQDVLARVLEVAGLNPVHVRNITDVDDKTIARAQEEGVALADFTQRWTEKFHADCRALNLRTPEHEPRATDHLNEQIALVQGLLDRGLAYAGRDGSVYFRVSGFADYGKLSHLKLEDLRTQDTQSAGSANLADEYERDQVADFALWKAYKESDGPVFWEPDFTVDGETKPFKGRPGWHLECSAMSTSLLGNTFDLHGGGIDLCFPHHENEIAQSEGASGEAPFARHWFHCAHLLVDGKKMSKSLGNLYTLEDLQAKGHSPMAVRYALLSAHYRQQLNFTLEGLAGAKSALDKLAKGARKLCDLAGAEPETFGRFQQKPFAEPGLFGPFEEAWEALCDDLNIPAAQGALFGALKDLDRLGGPDAALALKGFATVTHALGLTFDLNTGEENVEVPAEIEELAQKRWEAKQNKDFATADRLRGELQEKGWLVKDRKDGYDLTPA